MSVPHQLHPLAIRNVDSAGRKILFPRRKVHRNVWAKTPGWRAGWKGWVLMQLNSWRRV